MPRLISVDDTDWPEVRSINSYAIFMGYLLMGVRGLGLLVLTWTTVVLLGGFLSMLQKKDFWCLTVILLVQMAGVFDFLLKEKASDIGNFGMGLLAALFAMVPKPLKRDQHRSVSGIEEDKGQSIAPLALAIILYVVQLLVFVVLLCPLAVLYVLGLYISAGISLWRLIQHDYGYGNADGGENLKPALNILYFLAVAQGVIYGYRTIYDLAARNGLVEDVSSDYSLQTELVLNYLEETVTGCMKDPSFARGQNLITYAVHLLTESRSRQGYVSGVVILGTTLQPNNWYSGQRSLIKQLLTGSASSSHVVQRLLETFGPRSPYSIEVREHAARIVANVAGNIHLNQFPEGMIECISSLLDTFEEYRWQPEGYERHMNIPEEYGRDWLLEEDELFDIACSTKIPRPSAAGNKSVERHSNTSLQDFRSLVVQGLRILQKLAASEGNCRAIGNTEGLLSKIMAPLISDHRHEVVPRSLFYGHLLEHRDGWSIIAEESLELMSRLIAAPGATGRKLRSEISGNSKTIITAILECRICGVLLKRQAVEILLDLSGCMSCIASDGSRNTIFMGLLLLIFLSVHCCVKPDIYFRVQMLEGNYYGKMRASTHFAKRSSYIRKSAVENLQLVLGLQNERSRTSMLQSVAVVVADLTGTIVGARNNTYCRVYAADILKHLCERYTKDDEYLEVMKKAMIDVVPKVLEQILLVGHGSTSEGVQAVTEASNVHVSAQGTDLEKGDVQGNASSSSQQQNGEEHEGAKLRDALISLCRAIEKWIYKDEDLARQINRITADICSKQGMPRMTFDSFLTTSTAATLQLLLNPNVCAKSICAR